MMVSSQGCLYGYCGDYIGCLAPVDVNDSLLPVGPTENSFPTGIILRLFL